MDEINIGIIGASGYTGLELVRILHHHPSAHIRIITSESSAGSRISTIHPHLMDVCDAELVTSKDIDVTGLDLIFLALPHGVSMSFVKRYKNKDIRIIDLSGDFRLTSASSYRRWYSQEHVCPELLKKRIYGLPELFREEIINADLVANPGCYPTSAILPLAPLLSSNLISPEGIIIDSKSGVTGAGAKVKAITHYPSANENFTAYGIGTHRHTPEIEEIVSTATGADVTLQFTPHLTPINRGILSTIYCTPRNGTSQSTLNEKLASAYDHEVFIRLPSTAPSVQSVRGSNLCDIHVFLDERTNRVIAVSAIDNLVKGAAGQAVQNMNLMMGFREVTGLNTIPFSP